MEPHRPAPSRQPARPRRAAPRLDAAWLEREALRYVARQEATRAGVEALLTRRLDRIAERDGTDPAEARAALPEVVSRLVERGYVDDRRFSEQAIARLRRQGCSAAQIRQRLAARGAPEELVESLLRRRDERGGPFEEAGDEGSTAEDEDLAAAWRTARRRGLGPFRSDPEARQARRTRDLGVLARRGFSSEIAHRVIDADREAVLEAESEHANATGLGVGPPAERAP